MGFAAAGSFWFLFLSAVVAVESVVVQPPRDTVVAANSSRNISYTCKQEGSGREEGGRLRWEINGLQVWSRDQEEEFAATGVWLGAEGDSLTLLVTPEGREEWEQLSILCFSYTDPTGRLEMGGYSLTHYIIRYQAPGPVEDLELTYHSQSQLRLQWSRPSKEHPSIFITYTISIANSSSITTQQIDETYLLVSQRERDDCEVQSFTVVASSDAGTGIPSTITESTPLLSPSVTEIAESQEIDQVQLFGTSGVNVTVKFKAAKACNRQYPVVNYTLDIEGVGIGVISDSSDVVIATLSSAEFPGLYRDSKYLVSIGACNEFTCRESHTPLAIYTGDVADAWAVVYDKSVSVKCRLAEGTSAKSCLLVFTRFTDGGSENFTNTSASSDCPQLSQTSGAYLKEAVVFAVRSDDSTVLQPFNASVEDAMDSELTVVSCSLPNSTDSDIGSSDPSDSSSLSPGVVGGIVVGVVAVVSILVVVGSIIIVWLYISLKKRPKLEIGQSPTGMSEVDSDGHTAQLDSHYDSVGYMQVRDKKERVIKLDKDFLDHAQSSGGKLELFVIRFRGNQH